MFKGIINTDTAVAVNTNVPFTVVRNTNPNTRYDASTNEVVLNASGYYNVMAIVNATATAATVASAQLYGDGIAQSGIVSSVVPAAIGDSMTFTILDNIKVEPTLDNEKATISIRLDQAVTVNNAVIIVEKVR